MAGKKLYLEIDDIKVESRSLLPQYDWGIYSDIPRDQVILNEYTLCSHINNKTFKLQTNKDLILVDIDERYKNPGGGAKKVIFNYPATIVLWNDGTKTVVKCGDDEVWDPEKGLAMCIVKKAFGNKGNYWNAMRDMLKMGGVDPKTGKEESKEWSASSIEEAIGRVADRIRRYTIPTIKEGSNNGYESNKQRD